MFWDTDNISAANLNSSIGFDAEVDSTFASASGSKYQTLAAAISAGAKTIFMHEGEYAGATISGDNVFILGTPSYWNGTEFSGGTIITSLTTISGDGVVLHNLAFKNTSSTQIYVNGDQCRIEYCQFCDLAADSNCVAVDHGLETFWFNYNIINDNESDAAGILADANYNFIYCNFIEDQDDNVDSAGNGLEIGDFGDDGGGNKAVISGNVILDNAAYGVELNSDNSGDDYGKAILVGNVILDNGTAATVVTGAGTPVFHPSTTSTYNVTP